MRIGVLTTGFPRHDADTAGVFVLGLARALVERGHAIDVLAPEPREQCERPAWPGIELDWVRYVRPRAFARTFYGSGVPDNVAADARAWPGLASFPLALTLAARRRVARWDALVSHWALPCALAGGLVRRGRPHIAVLHSADVHLLGSLPGRARWASAIAAGASTLVFTCEQHRHRYLGWLPDELRAEVASRTCVQAMGVERPPARSVDREALRRELGMEGFSLLTVGRLVTVKGLVEAARALAPVHRLEWWIAGEGPERATLERIARTARARIRVVGEVHGASKAALFAAADAFLLPSRELRSGRSEGVPTSLAEAMAYGLPVLAAGVGGIPEHVGDGADGLLFDPDDCAALLHAVARLRGDPSLRLALGERARARSLARSWDLVAPRFESWLAPRAAPGLLDDRSQFADKRVNRKEERTEGFPVERADQGACFAARDVKPVDLPSLSPSCKKIVLETANGDLASTAA